MDTAHGYEAKTIHTVHRDYRKESQIFRLRAVCDSYARRCSSNVALDPNVWLALWHVDPLRVPFKRYCNLTYIQYIGGFEPENAAAPMAYC